MDDDLNDDQRVLLDASTRFIEQTFPLTRVRARGYDDAYRRQAAELGWFSLLVPEDLGGGSVSGNGVVDAALVAYRRGALLQPGPFIGTNLVAHALAVGGGDEQRTKVLPTLLAGEASASWVPALRDGRASFVEDPGPDGWLLLGDALVPVDAPGVRLVPVESLDLTRRFVEVHIDEGALDGAPHVDTGDLLPLACVLTAAETVGAMDHELAMTVEYAKDRIAFGRPIGSFQAIKHLLADTSLALEMSKAITLAAAQHVGAGDYGAEAASMAKAFVGDAGIDLAQSCFQVFGGIGFTWEHDQHLYLRRITSDASLFGDPASHRERVCQLSGV